MRFGVASLWGMGAYVVIPDLFRDLLTRISLQIRFLLLLPIAQSLRSKRPHRSMPISLVFRLSSFVYNLLQVCRCNRVACAAEVADHVQVLVLAAQFLQVLER